MPQRVVNDLPVADIPRIKDRHRGLVPLALGEAGRLAFEGGLHQNVDRCGGLGEVELVHHLEIGDPLREFVLVVDHFDRELADRRVRLELGAEHIEHIRTLVRRIDQAFGGEDEDRVGAVQRHPLATLGHPGLDLRGLFLGRHQITGIGDEEAAGVEPLQPRIIGSHGGADLRMFGQQLEDLEPRIVDIVIFAGSDEVRIDAGGGLLAHVSS